MAALRECLLPGCTNQVTARSTTGMCGKHMHRKQFCRCRTCRQKRGEAVPPPPAAAPQPARFTPRNERAPKPVTLARAPWEASP